MAFTIEWGNAERTILQTTYQTGWTWDELIHKTAEIQKNHMGSVEHPVCLIEVLEGDIPVPRLGWTHCVQSTGVHDHPNFAAAVIVTQSSLSWPLAQIFKMVLPEHGKNLHVAPTVEQAYQTAQELLVACQRV